MALSTLRVPRLAFLLVILSGGVAGAIFQHRASGGVERTYYDAGVAAVERRDLPAATAAFERAIQLNPRYGDAYEMLSASYLASGKVGRALDVLDRLRTIEPHRPHLYTRISEAYVTVNNVYTLRWARQAVLLEPRSPRARMVLALGLVRSGDLRDAAAEMEIGENLAAHGSFSQRPEPPPAREVTTSQLTTFLAQQTPRLPY